jgi:hypothetical protein
MYSNGEGKILHRLSLTLKIGVVKLKLLIQAYQINKRVADKKSVA